MNVKGRNVVINIKEWGKAKGIGECETRLNLKVRHDRERNEKLV